MSPAAGGLLVAGSIALDTLEGPFGTVTDELGGSALYFSLAASLISPVTVVAPVGRDAVDLVRAAVAGRPIDRGRLAILEAPTYRWRARQVEGANIDLGSRDVIYDLWRPDLPDNFSGWGFVGSMRPRLQAEASRRLPGASLLAGDSMRSYVASQPEEARELLGLCGWFFCNQEELVGMGGDPAAPDGFRRAWGLDGLVVKAGEGGVSAHTAAGATHVPALLTRPVVDTTGAGDTLAGGMLAWWRSAGGGPEDLGEALVHGVACASLAIEEVGLRGIAAATAKDLEERLEEVRACL